MEIFAPITFLVLGWLFGLLSPQIVDIIRRHYKEEEIKRGLITEMKEIKFRMSLVVFQMALEFGTIDRPLIHWLQQNLEEYEGQNSNDKVIEHLKKLSKTSDTEFDAITKTMRETQENSIFSLKIFSLPFLDSNIEYLSLFKERVLCLICEIKAQVNILNEEIENVSYYAKLTFDSTISPENYKIIKRNLKMGYQNVGSRARVVVEKINSLIGKIKTR